MNTYLNKDTVCLQERGGTNMWCGNDLFNSTPCKIWGKYIYDSCFFVFVYLIKKRKSDCQKPSIHSSELDITWCTICYNASTSVDIWPWWWWILVFLAVWFLFLKGSRERKTVKVSRLVLWSLSLTRLSMPRRGLRERLTVSLMVYCTRLGHNRQTGRQTAWPLLYLLLEQNSCNSWSLWRKHPTTRTLLAHLCVNSQMNALQSSLGLSCFVLFYFFCVIDEMSWRWWYSPIRDLCVVLLFVQLNLHVFFCLQKNEQ